ncbi:thiamine transporter [Melghirimyces thermohalophilus]|uniref:Thiamine transporter n=1 Tax=Melghirimyces thermohalophilus TaxID=1236220 RepID=A0A1G6NGT1_9BACL|nr:energy-coupled thiamine transporter ThiT [Melghirimyces thermohalophilus]SDC67053.1 thiamine transporter [Melghirimyces thermohalophilus]
MPRTRLMTLVEVAVMAAIGGILSIFPVIKLWPQGGSVSLVMVPVALVAFRRGWVAGVGCGLLVGLIDLMLGPFILHPVQVLLDYPVSFAALGLAGLFRPRWEQERSARSLGRRLASGIVLAGLVRFIIHFISGVIWFGAFAPKAFSPALYSFFYNISYIFPEVLVTLVIMLLLTVKAPRLVLKP